MTRLTSQELQKLSGTKGSESVISASPVLDALGFHMRRSKINEKTHAHNFFLILLDNTSNKVSGYSLITCT